MTVVPLVPRIKLLKLAEVETLTNCKRSTIYTKIREGTFPRPKRFGRNSMWSEEAINKWVSAQLQEGQAEATEGENKAQEGGSND